MNILDKIIADKKAEVKLKKEAIPVEAWTILPDYDAKRKSLKASLLKENSSGVIAEFKRRSPSKGIINEKVDLSDVISGYNEFAAGISVLTDEKYFGGSNNDLIEARNIASIPILRKDFIIDEYQLYEARGIGADVILLIAANLTKQQVNQFASKAKELDLEVLLEIHNEDELEHICDEVDLVGVNNRNLKTFEVDINTSLKLMPHISKDKIAIAESGISNVDTIMTLRQAGFKGFLIGEKFMKAPIPAIAFAEFMKQLKAKIK